MKYLHSFSYRQISAILLLIPAALLAFGYYLQFVDGLDPCPLCMTQRLAFYGIAITALIAIMTPQSLWIQHFLAALGSLITLIGLSVSGRQLWLQTLPEDQIPACGPGFNFIIETFPLLTVIEIMFRGNGNCAEVAWMFLGLSIPGWSFIAFAFLLLLNLAKIFKNSA